MINDKVREHMLFAKNDEIAEIYDRIEYIESVLLIIMQSLPMNCQYEMSKKMKEKFPEEFGEELNKIKQEDLETKVIIEIRD